MDDWIFFKVSPLKGIMRFSRKGKLSPRYIRLCRIIWRIGKVSYDLELPSELESVHPVLHVSILQKCIKDPSRVMPIDAFHIMEDLSYEEVLVSILV